MNPGHVGGRRVLSPLRHHCSPSTVRVEYDKKRRKTWIGAWAKDRGKKREPGKKRVKTQKELGKKSTLMAFFFSVP